MKGLVSVERVIDAATKTIANITEARTRYVEDYLKLFIGPRKTYFFGLFEERPEIKTIEDARKFVTSLKYSWSYWNRVRAGVDQQEYAERLLKSGNWLRITGVDTVWVTDKDAEILKYEHGVTFGD